jgi:hypothetical protein
MTFTIDVVDQNTVTIFQSLPDLALVGNNVLDLLRTLPGFQAAAQSPTQAVSASPTIARAPSSASISGIVHDESNAMIPGVTVSLTHLDTGQTLTVTSDETGRYEFSSIQGKYRLTASLPGFRTTTINDLSIGSSQSQQDVTLIVGFEPRILVVPTPDPPETRTIAVAPLPIIERDPQKGIATGIVRGPDGKPAARLRVAVVTPPETPGDRASTSLSVQTETDEQGRYVLQGIPRGRYMIAAGRVDNPTYFPGTLDMARATILSIEPGMFFTELNFSTTVRNERPLDASTNTTASRSDPGPGPCVPNTARCTLLHRVQ